jgi:hypothetical protein
MVIEEILSGIGRTIIDIIGVSWWVILPVGLFFVWNEFWLWGKNRIWKRKINWVLLEIKIPKMIEKTPKAMENIFAALHAIGGKEPDFEAKYFRGEEPLWLTCELVGYAGGVHFFIRFPSAARNLVESVIYSEYPNAELIESEDYVNLMPDILPNDIYDIWGQDFILAKKNPYPIKTYSFFESVVVEQRLDPIAAITEVMSRLKEGEVIWLQYLIKPAGDEWKKEGEEVRDKIMQRKKPAKEQGFFESVISGAVQFLKNLTLAPAEYPIWPEAEKKEERGSTAVLSPGEKNILAAVENKISKLGFKTAIRFVYIDRRDSFSPANISAVSGALKQFNTLDMNGFQTLGETVTKITGQKLTYKGWFRNRRTYYRQRVMYDMYKLRWFPPKASIFNTEELATVFHFPIVTVEAPLLRRLETKKGEPPANLPFTG